MTYGSVACLSLLGRTTHYRESWSYSTVVLYSRDRYEIIGLCKSSHSIKQPCNSICLKKRLQFIKVVEIMQYLALAKQSGKSNISICSKHLKSQASPKFRLPASQPASQPAVRLGSTRYRPPDFSQFMYSHAGFSNFSIHWRFVHCAI